LGAAIVDLADEFRPGVLRYRNDVYGRRAL
jgi:hypothetical protein